MLVPADEPCPLPDDPILRQAADAAEAIGLWSWIVDADWNVRYYTHHQRLSAGLGLHLVPVEIDVPFFSTPAIENTLEWPVGPGEASLLNSLIYWVGPLMLADFAGRRDDLMGRIDPRVAETLGRLEPSDEEIVASTDEALGSLDRPTYSQGTVARLRDDSGRSRGVMMQWKPAVPMTTLGVLAFDKDLGHLERVMRTGAAGRRPSAVLFGDIEGSSALSKTMSTSGYFNLVRRIVRVTDQAIVDHGGVVGRHVGDGVVAFFPVESLGSESAAARASIEAARKIQTAMPGVAERSGVDPELLTVRFGLHWGGSVFMGNISTSARSEVTALGDEVNEGARIEACASGGRILASKPLIERLDRTDGAAIDVDPDRIAYVQLGDLATATDKARRDAPAIAVCEL